MAAGAMAPGVGQAPRRDDRGDLYRRRIRHPDPVGQGERRARDWLTQNGYKIPQGAAPVLASYLKQNMRFFVAKVNIGEQEKLGFTYLRPLQIAYESPKFMLPIRLGTVNADGPQELFVFTLTNKGRVETTNYRTVSLPSDVEIPIFVKDDFGHFYKSMFTTQVEKESMRGVPRVRLGHGLVRPVRGRSAVERPAAQAGRVLAGRRRDADADQGVMRPRPIRRRREQRLRHAPARALRRRHFPEDLVFQETGDRTNFQGRYVLRHAWTGGETCAEADAYRRELGARREQEAQTLASLTGWDINEIRRKQGPGPRAAVTIAPGGRTSGRSSPGAVARHCGRA